MLKLFVEVLVCLLVLVLVLVSISYVCESCVSEIESVNPISVSQSNMDDMMMAQVCIKVFIHMSEVQSQVIPMFVSNVKDFII